MEYFECDVDNEYVDEQSKLHSVLIKLPWYGFDCRTKEICHLRLNVRPTKGENWCSADYSIEKVHIFNPRSIIFFQTTTLQKAPSMEKLSEEDLQRLLTRSAERSTKRQKGRFSIISFIDSLYFTAEEIQHPGKRVVIRDFCYSIYDPRHWGRPLPSLLDKAVSRNGAYRVRAKFDFDAGTDSELSMQKGDLLYVVADFGNGWVSVRRSNSPLRPSASSSETDSVAIARQGLVPENYVERIA